MKYVMSILIFWLCLAGSIQAGPPSDPIAGKYIADDRQHGIEIWIRGGVLRGRIAWTKKPTLTDQRSKDPKLRGRRVAGIEHIRGFTKSTDGAWTGGTLYNPEDGNTYQAKLWLDGNERLIIQGRPSVPLLGPILGALFGRIHYTRE